jgi:hypothetical protein
MAVIERDKLRQLVSDWQNGSVAVQDVHEHAEEYCEVYDRPDLSEVDPKSIAVEVLAQLEILNHQLVTTDDVPAILRFLDTPTGAEAKAWDDWRSYWDAIDYDARKSQLRENDYYIT